MFFIIILMTLYINNVPTELTSEDLIYINKIMERCNIKPLDTIRTYEEEIIFLQKLQDSVICYYPIGIGIPLNQQREPKNLYELNEGLCYDRSRVFEKICKSQGFETRHVFLLLDENVIKSKIAIFRKDSISTHAVSEIRTHKGWLVIGSNYPWLALDKSNNPLSMKEISKYNKTGEIPTKYYNTISPNEMWYNANLIYIYGLYSRTGRLYEPFNFIPDLNFRELLFNIGE
jgi:hypothetical protein